jgi:hypothetical protein
MKTALPIGILDPEEAPWWRFSCAEFEPVVKQWMGSAAACFAADLALRNAGGEVTLLECQYTSLDGMQGTYLCQLSEHNKDFIFVVTRDPEPVQEPEQC